ncbi:MAG: DUF503 domain-containing protein [Phycisphaerae bacterium]
MTVGILQVELSIPGSMSLKDKRRVVKSVKDRISHRHNVSIAEVGGLDQWRTAILGVAMVGNDQKYVEGGLQAIVNFLRTQTAAELVDQQIDFV